MVACRNVYGGCIKYLLRNLSVIEFGQFGGEILYSDTQPKCKIAHITHKIAHMNHFKTRMWANNAQHDGRPAEYRWRPLSNAAKFG